MITSKSNATVVAAAKLKDKKGRREQGKFLIEGRKLIRDAAARGVTFDRIFVTEDFSGDLPGDLSFQGWFWVVPHPHS